MKKMRKISVILIVMAALALLLAVLPISAAAYDGKVELDVIDPTPEDTIVGSNYDETMPETDSVTAPMEEAPTDETAKDPEQWDPHPAARIYADGLTIATSDAEFGDTQYYFYRVLASGEGFSSFAMELAMPDFVDVVEVIPTPELLNVSENAVFDCEISGNDICIAFSSPYNFYDIPLFEICFSVNNYAENFGWVECHGWQIVNEDVETPEAYVMLGSIAIAPRVTMGDVDGDGDVDLADLLVIQRSIVSDSYWLDDQQFRAADIDKNGSVDMLDCQYIQNYLVGKISDLENIGITVPDIPDIPDIPVTPPDIPGDPIDCDHENTFVDEMEPTCTDWGYSREVCKECNLILRDTEIEPLGHNFEDGYCTRCGEGDKDDDSNAELAQLIEEAVAKAERTWNSLFDKGVTASTIAEYENQYFSIIERMWKADSVEVLELYQVEFNAMINKILRTMNPDVPTGPEDCAHSTTWTENSKADCYAPSYQYIYCYECNALVSEKIFRPALGHNFEDGYCTRCGEPEDEWGDIVEPEIPADPGDCKHEKTWTETSEPTCTANSYEFIFCYTCETLVSEKLVGKAFGHNFVDGICTRCNESEWGDVVEPEIPAEPEVCKHEHNYTDSVGATCTEDGVIRYLCSDCGNILGVEYFKATGHDFVEGICTRCGESEATELPEEKVDLYSYSSSELTIVLYSDYTSFYTRMVYTADGMKIKENGEDKWYEMDGRIYAFVADEQYAFLVKEDGKLALVK